MLVFIHGNQIAERVEVRLLPVAEEALEAAHISPYSEFGESEAQNGLLLRADIHTLFDLNLIGINPESLVVVVADRLSATCYNGLAGKVIASAASPQSRPSKVALAERWKDFKQRE